MQRQQITAALYQIERVHFDLARRYFDFLATSRTLVQWHATLLDRRIGRRDLHDATAQPGKRRLDPCFIQLGNRARAHDLAFRIVGRRCHPEPALSRIRLARTEQIARDFGRFAEADRQQPGCERIEAAGMAGLFRTE